MLMPGHTFVYSPSVNKVRELIRRRRARRDLLHHLLADEPRPLPAGRRRPRPRPPRPLDPPALARQAAGRGRPPTAAASSTRACTRPPSSPCASRAAPRPTSRSPGWRRARCARWSSSAAGGWSSTRTPPPTTRSASTTAASTSPSRRRTSASTGSPTAPATWSRRGSRRVEPLGLELKDFASAIREGTTPVSNARLGPGDRARPRGAGGVASRPGRAPAGALGRRGPGRPPPADAARNGGGTGPGTEEAVSGATGRTT